MKKVSALDTINFPNQFSSLRSIGKALLTIIIVATIAITAWKLNEKLDLTGPLMSVSFVVGTALAIAYRVVNPYGWALVIRGMGCPVDALDATRIWLVSESRRWLPGGIWGYASRAVGAQELGLTKTVASASMAVELLVTIAAAVVVSIAGLIIHQQELAATVQKLTEGSGLSVSLISLAVAGTAALAVASWFMRETLNRKLANLTRKITALRGLKIQPSGLCKALSYFVLMAALNGFVNASLLPAISPEYVPLLAMIAATATAWVIGFFAFFSPGGILVREAALAALLLPWLPYETGFALAILSRFAQLIAEVVGMAVAYYFSRKAVAR